MLKKVSFFLLIICLFPSIVFASPFYGGDYSNPYFGYEIDIEYPNNTFALSAYINQMYAEDVVNPIQVLDSNVDRDYRISLIYRSIFASDYYNVGGGYASVSGNDLNYTDVRFYEQDICVSNNNISFYVVNGSVDDFASNSHPYTFVTDQKCTIWENSARPSDVIGPMYWEWLGDYQGYVVKVFLPIANYRLRSNDVYNAVSRLHIVNNSDHTIYFRFLTSGGLYDHSRALDYDLNFDLDTKNFDLTYQAVQDGVSVLDSISGLKFQISKNLLDISHFSSFPTGFSVTYLSDGGIHIVGTNNSNTRVNINLITRSENKLFLEPGTYTLSGLSGGSINTYYLRLSNGTDDISVVTNGFNTFTYSGSNTLSLGLFLSVRPRVSVDVVIYPQLEFGSFPTIYCPYGLTLNQSCVNNTLNNSFEWVEGSFVDNVSNFIKLPISLMSSFVNGSGGQCTPISFTIFNQNISLPCGDFFWLRNDVSSFRLIWTILFGGFILFKTMVWCFRVLASVLDPMGNSLSTGLDIYREGGK